MSITKKELFAVCIAAVIAGLIEFMILRKFGVN